MAFQKVVLWKPLMITVAAIIALSIFTYFFNKSLSVILILAALGIISRIPAGLSTYLNPLEMVDFFGVSIALAYGPIQGAIFSFVVFLFSRLFFPNEWPMYTIKWALTIAMGAVVFYYLFPLIGNISTLFTLMILWNSLSYTFILTPLLEREALLIEMYYDIMLSPIAILHRMIISLVGGEFLHQVLLSGSSKIIYLYIFAAVFAAVLWFGKDILKKINETVNKSGVFDPDRKKALENLVSKTGFDLGEAKGIIASTIVLALALTAGQWGGATFSIKEGLKNLAIAMPVVMLSFVAHEKAHKWGAQRFGTYAKFKPAWPMMAFTAVIGIISSGWVVITVVGNSVLTSLKRVGFKFPFISPESQARITLLGPAISLALVILSKVFMGIFGETRLLQDMFTFNLWMTFFNMIPFVMPFEKSEGLEQAIFPPFDGAYVLGGAPQLFVGFLAFAIITVLGLLLLPIWAAIILGGIAGVVGWLWAHSDTVLFHEPGSHY